MSDLYAGSDLLACANAVTATMHELAPSFAAAAELRIGVGAADDARHMPPPRIVWTPAVLTLGDPDLQPEDGKAIALRQERLEVRIEGRSYAEAVALLALMLRAVQRHGATFGYDDATGKWEVGRHHARGALLILPVTLKFHMTDELWLSVTYETTTLGASVSDELGHDAEPVGP